MNLNARLDMTELEKNVDELKKRDGAKAPTPAQLDNSTLHTAKVNVERHVLRYLQRMMNAKCQEELMNILCDMKYTAPASDWLKYPPDEED